MRFSLVAGLIATLALAQQATANITGFSAPSYPIKEGETFNVTFTTKNSLTNNQREYTYQLRRELSPHLIFPTLFLIILTTFCRILRSLWSY
jgi:hypothetical protein